MEYQVIINGITVNAHFNDVTIEEVIRPLLLRLSELSKKKGGRLLVMLAAPPGAGKSTLVSFLEYLAKDIIPEYKVQAVGMDGFHRRQEYLLTHTTVVDGKEVPMVNIKGAPITFDLDGLKTKIGQVLGEKTCGWPLYDRHLHNAVEDAITITGDIVLLEGNYLLLDEEGWRDLKEKADYTIFIKSDEEMLRRRLIDRKEASGNSREKAEAFVDYSDMRNVRLCLEHSMKADLVLSVDDKGDYIVEEG